MDENENLEDEQFNSMLSAAQKQVGVNTPAPSEEEPQPGGGTGKLSQAQIEAMLALNSDTFDTGDSADNNKGEDNTVSGENNEANAGQTDNSEEAVVMTPPVQDEDADIADRFRAQIDAERQENTEPAAGDGKKKKKKEKAPKEKKEKKPLDPVTLWRILTVAAAVVALALGFCICLLMFTDVIKSGNDQFAIRAANAVNSKLRMNTDFYVCRAYVNNGTLADECMLYGYTSYEGKEKLDMYRVVVEKNAPSIVNIYYTIDENSTEYIAMKNSDNSKDRISASQLKYHSDAIYAADMEIQINSPKWEKIDCAMLNKNITSVQSR